MGCFTILVGIGGVVLSSMYGAWAWALILSWSLLLTVTAISLKIQGRQAYISELSVDANIALKSHYAFYRNPRTASDFSSAFAFTFLVSLVVGVILAVRIGVIWCLPSLLPLLSLMCFTSTFHPRVGPAHDELVRYLEANRSKS